MGNEAVYICSDGLCRQSLAEKREKLQGYEMQINSATKGVDLDASLTSVQSKLQSHQEYVLRLLLHAQQKLKLRCSLQKCKRTFYYLFDFVNCQSVVLITSNYSLDIYYHLPCGV